MSTLSRRSFLAGGALLLAGCRPASNSMAHSGDKGIRPAVKFSLITDLHYADKPRAGTRYYRQSITKLLDVQPAIETFGPSFVAELGDFVDAAEVIEVELEYLRKINNRFAQLPGEKHFVLGNHCVYSLTKTEFLQGVGQDKSFYSFDQGDFHFIVLDACFRHDEKPYERRNFEWTDTNIPRAESRWLADDLSQTDKRTIVFTHQRLDEKPSYSIKNAAEIRQILGASNKVLAVFQGHSHLNALQEYDGVHYCTLHAMVEGSGLSNNGAANVELFADGSIRLTGLHKQKNYRWE